MARRFGIVFILGLLLAACTGEPDAISRAPIDQVSYAEQFLELVRTHSIDQAAGQFSPSVDQDKARQLLENVSTLIQKQEVSTVRVVAYDVVTSDASPAPMAQISLRYYFTSGDALQSTMVLARDSQRFVIQDISFLPLPAPLIQMNSFFGAATSVWHYLYLALAAVVVLFVLTTLYFCIRASAPRWRWRWLWVIAIFMTVMRLQLEWSTLAVVISPIGLVPFGFWFSKGGMYASYIFTIGFPLGAIAYWIYRWRANKRTKLPMVAIDEIAAQ